MSFVPLRYKWTIEITIKTRRFRRQERVNFPAFVSSASLCCRSHCRVTDPNPRPETQSLIEPVNARVRSTALHKHVVTVHCPGLSERSLNHGFPVTSASQLGMSDNIFQKPVASSTPQQIRRNNKHAGRSDPISIVRHEHVDSRLRQGAAPNALGALSRLGGRTHL